MITSPAVSNLLWCDLKSGFKPLLGSTGPFGSLGLGTIIEATELPGERLLARRKKPTFICVAHLFAVLALLPTAGFSQEPAEYVFVIRDTTCLSREPGAPPAISRGTVVQVLGKHERSVLLYAKGGNCEVAKHDVSSLAEAISMLSQEIDAQPTAENLCLRGLARAAIGGIPSITQAISDLDQAIRQDPKYAKAFLTRGGAYAALQKFETAIADFDQAISIDPRTEGAYAKRAKCRLAMGQHDKAIGDLEEASRIDPSDALPYYERGVIRTKFRDYTKAIADLDEAIRIDSRSSLPFLTRGAAKLFVGQSEEAVKDLDEAIRIDPRSAIAYTQRGSILIEHLGDISRGIADLEQAARLRPTFALPFKGLAWVYATCSHSQHRDGKKALAYATWANKLQPGDHLLDLAAAHAEVANFDQAIRCCDLLLARVPASRSIEVEQNVGLLKRMRESFTKRKPWRHDPTRPYGSSD